MTNKHMPFIPFDQRLIGKEILYIFPLPRGPRCIVRTNGTVITITDEGGEDLTGFVPDVAEQFNAVYSRMLSEPNPLYTLNGKQVKFPYVYFDVILHDRVANMQDDGTDEYLREAIEDTWDFLGEPADAGKIRATVLCTMMEDEYKKGRTQHDLWWKRAAVKRALISAGHGCTTEYPLPIIGWLEIATSDKDANRSGIATDSIDTSWDYIYNIFSRKHAGALIADVWAGWNVNGKAFRVLKEEDVEI